MLFFARFLIMDEKEKKRMNFDRQKFFAGFRKAFDTLSQSQVDALNDLLNFIEKDDLISDVRHISYILATTYHETAKTFRPIHEYGGRSYFINRYGGQTALGKRLGNDTAEEGAIYAGRGFVQLTGEYNYETAEKDMRSYFPDVVNAFEERTGKKFDLTVGDDPNDSSDPDNAMDAEIAYFIMSNGMREGRFTGKKLRDYISGRNCDYVAARRIINGTDRASTIANYARSFEAILKASSLERAGLSASGDIPEQVLQASSPDAPLALENETASVTIKDGDVKVETNKPAIPPEKIAIEKPPAKSFGTEIKKDLAVVGGGNIGFQGVRDVAEQAGGWGLSARFWLWVSIFAVVGGAAYILAKFFKWRSEVKRDLELTQQLIAANSTPTNRIVFVDSEKLEEFRANGYKIVTR